jgi:2-polyprenyl-3-methyl-5-hydroxy-6-metoxy-1,4-benzoquinol methylase
MNVHSVFAAAKSALRNRGFALPKQNLQSCMCTERTLTSDDFQNWAEKLGEAPGHLHRKVWEWCFISQALQERGVLNSGKTGLGFAVGQEPLSAAFANCGANIVATDLFTAEAQANGWVETSQHASGYDAINNRGLCSDADLRRLVEFKFANMNDISPEFDGKFDFVWSSCSLEHLGTLEHGKQFILNAMKCLKPGGIAVHTTEFNTSSDSATVESGDTVLYRACDIKDIARRLRAAGHSIKIDWDHGSGVADGFVDLPPYKHVTHLKLQIEKYVVTSIGLIIQKAI